MKKRPNRLRALRTARDITQLDLALRIGVGQTRYWQIENGYRLPTAGELARLAKALGVGQSECDLKTEQPRNGRRVAS